MTSDELNNFAAAYAKAWCSRDPEKVAAFYAKHARISVNGGPPTRIVEVARGFIRDFPDIVVMFDRIEETPDGTEFHWTFTGTNTGPNGTGSKVRISGYELWKMDNRRLIAQAKGHFDAVEQDRQLRRGLGDI